MNTSITPIFFQYYFVYDLVANRKTVVEVIAEVSWRSNFAQNMSDTHTQIPHLFPQKTVFLALIEGRTVPKSKRKDWISIFNLCWNND